MRRGTPWSPSFAAAGTGGALWAKVRQAGGHDTAKLVIILGGVVVQFG
jgi:hypothetical protein